MIKGLVSIISPCYNREKILFRLLDSILEQTYKKIQVVLVDDGSTDRTREVIESYQEKFEQAGILYEYYYQENAGVSAAINTGLQYVKGEFLCWPDSDDWYDKESIRKRVEFLNTHPEYGIVSSDADFFVADDLNTPKGFISGKCKERFAENQFELMLQGKTIVSPICHMARSEAFFSMHPTRKIFDSRHGQNIQMLLPIYYKYKRGFIDEPLGHYLILENSLSRSDDTYEKQLAYRNAIEELTLATLESIDIPREEKCKYIKFTRVKNTRRRLLLAKKYKDIGLAKEQRRKLREYGDLRLRDLW